MITYTYSALDDKGQRTQGSISAPSRSDAIRRLTTSGQNVTDLREQAGASAASPVSFSRRAIKLSAFARQMATLSSSGVPLVQSLNVIIEQSDQPKAVAILKDVRASIEGGSTLADALARHPRTFPRIMTGMVRVGEVGGTLDEIMAQLAELYEKEESLKSEVHAALAYPALVLFLGFLSAIFLLTFLVPRLRTLFEGFGQQLPLPTRILLGISDTVVKYGWLVVFLVPVVVIAVKLISRSHKARRAWAGFQLRVPWVGKLILNVSVARFTRLLGTLTRGGISFTDGIEIVHTAIGNQVVADAIESMSREVRAGESVAAVMKKAGIFPAMPVQMVAIGEETGKLDQMLLRAAEAYEQESAATTRVMVSLLAPLMILCVAFVIGFLILSILLPIFQLSSVMR